MKDFFSCIRLAGRDCVKKRGYFFLAFLVSISLFLLFSQAALAFDQAVIDSRNWEDVYSGMLYASVKHIDGSYIVEESHGLILPDTLPRMKKNVVLFESKDNPYIKNYKTNLEAKGFNVSSEVFSGSLNLKLAKELQKEGRIKGFIIINPVFPYNAVSVAPYAVLEKYYVVFADKDNIDDVYGFLLSLNAPKIIVYGAVDREVAQRLTSFQPEKIDKGSKFLNNLEIASKFIEAKKVRQAVLTDGSFIEEQFFYGDYPIIFIGKTNLPEETISFVKEKGIKYAILVGYDVFNNAVTLKNKAGIKVMVKFAKGVNKQQFALDIFKLPVPKFNIAVDSVSYNSFSRQLEIRFVNKEPYPARVKSSTNIKLGNSSVASVADNASFFIDASETKTIAYNVDLSKYSSKELVAAIDVLFGNAEDELEYLSRFSVPIKKIAVKDSSEIEFIGINYNIPTKRLIIEIKNIGTEPVYLKPEIIDVLVDGIKHSYSGELLKIMPGKSRDFKIRIPLTAADIEDNAFIKAIFRYGSRQDALVKIKEAKAKLVTSYITSQQKIALAAAAAVVVAIALIIILLAKRRKKKRHFERHYKHKLEKVKRE